MLRHEFTGLLAGLLMIRHYRHSFGRWPGLVPPRTFNERQIYRALFDRNPLLRTMCDKFAMRSLVAERVGERYVVPVLARWQSIDEVDLAALPPNVVLKPRASSGHVLILLEGESLDRAVVMETIREWLAPPSLRDTIRLEWAYHGVPASILAEPLQFGADGQVASDLDVYIFHGRAVLLRTLTGIKHTPGRRDAWFDRSGRQVDIGAETASVRMPLSPELIAEAIEVAEALGAGWDMLRVDFWVTGDGLKVGELSPYHMSGQTHWRNPGHDRLLGDWWAKGADTSALDDFPG